MTNDKKMRAARAKERNDAAEKANLSPEQRLQSLDTKFGPGLGAKKERAKLTALLGKSKPAAKAAPAPGAADSITNLANATLPDSVMDEIAEMNKPSEKKSKKKK